MKLIDILVRELDKRDGWPHEAEGVVQDTDGRLWFYQEGIDGEEPQPNSDGVWSAGDIKRWVGDDLYLEVAQDCRTVLIHRHQYEAALAASKEMLINKPDADGWIAWGGGECPVDGDVVVDVKYLGGNVSYATESGLPASEYGWGRFDKPTCIVAYRLHKKDDDQPVWNGEGMPPAGCECEYTKQSLPGNEWTECTVDYVGSSFVVYRDCYGVELTGIKGDISFRPIRTEAERKRDDIAKSINEAADASGTLGYVLYDAIAAGSIPGVKLEAPDA